MLDKETKKKIRLARNLCPIEPFGGHVIMMPIEEKTIGAIQLPPGEMAARLERGEIIIMAAIATAPDDLVVADVTARDPRIKAGDLYYVKVPFNPTSESVTYQDPESRSLITVFAIPQTVVVGRVKPGKEDLAR